jgi:hypothetical protein
MTIIHVKYKGSLEQAQKYSIEQVKNAFQTTTNVQFYYYFTEINYNLSDFNLIFIY